jgi:hypothetical protein
MSESAGFSVDNTLLFLYARGAFVRVEIESSRNRVRNQMKSDRRTPSEVLACSQSRAVAAERPPATVHAATEDLGRTPCAWGQRRTPVSKSKIISIVRGERREVCAYDGVAKENRHDE